MRMGRGRRKEEAERGRRGVRNFDIDTAGRPERVERKERKRKIKTRRVGEGRK